MTMIDVDTSPLQAAREWRGIGLVAAAMTSGLPMAQAEALEEGDTSAFASIDEMIAAAIVYGSSIGIGRDEAMALLDRTVSRQGVQVELPDPAPARPSLGFSQAVQARTAHIATREAVATEPILPAPHTPSWVDDTHGDVLPGGVGIDELHAPAMAAVASEPVAPDAAFPVVPGVPLPVHGPTPEQAVAASGEIHLDEFGPEAPWERTGYTSELEAWVEDHEDGAEPIDRPRRGAGVGTRALNATHGALERVVGTERADAAADWLATTAERIGDTTRDWRERMRRSEHATLFVAIGGGAVLIALVVAIGGALGGEDTAGPGPADREAVKAANTTPTTDAAGTGAATEGAAKPATLGPPLTPAQLTLDVFNAGSKKGYAKEVAAKLEGYGYKVDEVTNAKSDYAGATIIHPREYAREAKVLARRTGISTLQIAPGSSKKITIIVT